MYLKLTVFSSTEDSLCHCLAYQPMTVNSNLVGTGCKVVSVVNFEIKVVFSLVPADRYIRQFVVEWRPGIININFNNYVGV